MYKNARNTRTWARDRPRRSDRSISPQKKLVSWEEEKRDLAERCAAVPEIFDRAEAAAKANNLRKSKTKVGAEAVVRTKAVAGVRANELRERITKANVKKMLPEAMAAAKRKKLAAMLLEEPARNKALMEHLESTKGAGERNLPPKKWEWRNGLLTNRISGRSFKFSEVWWEKDMNCFEFEDDMPHVRVYAHEIDFKQSGGKR